MFVVQNIKRKIAEKRERGYMDWVASREAYLLLGLGSVVVGVIFGVTVGVLEEGRVRDAVTEGKSCRMFDKGDRVSVVRGPSEGVTGEIVAGCDKGDKYVIEPDEGQTETGTITTARHDWLMVIEK